jgi:hypothetical protein
VRSPDRSRWCGRCLPGIVGEMIAGEMIAGEKVAGRGATTHHRPNRPSQSRHPLLTMADTGGVPVSRWIPRGSVGLGSQDAPLDHSPRLERETPSVLRLSSLRLSAVRFSAPPRVALTLPPRHRRPAGAPAEVPLGVPAGAPMGWPMGWPNGWPPGPHVDSRVGRRQQALDRASFSRSSVLREVTPLQQSLRSRGAAASRRQSRGGRSDRLRHLRRGLRRGL